MDLRIPSRGESPQPVVVPPPNLFAAAPPTLHTTALSPPSLPQISCRPPGYASNSHSHSTSPSTASGHISELQNYDTPSLMISPTHISSANLNAQKRAYRQRRKDPSCDACRERKVKCDATDTSACSECSSRNHKCQFTKETNRRMSSIKQVQDLQSQIAELTQMNTHLRTKSTYNEKTDTDRTEMKRRHSGTHTRQHPVPDRLFMPVVHNFDHARENIRTHAKGIFDVPDQRISEPTDPPVQLPELPPRAEFAYLSQSYLDTIHVWYPAIHWPTFQREVDELYATRSFRDRPRDWAGLFFAVLACGSLDQSRRMSSTAATRGKHFADIAAGMQTPCPGVFSIAHVQLALLLSIWFTETNIRSVGSAWLATAVRAAQELNVHSEHLSQSTTDREKHRRLWWAIYVRDRLTSLESSRPMIINESDCETVLPSYMDERCVQTHEIFRHHADLPPSPGFVAIAQITRLYAPLYQTLKSSTISPGVLQSYDEQFRSKMLSLPDHYHLNSNATLESIALVPLFTLLSARFHLYRRNLSPLCCQADRTEALNRCTSVAQDTAKYISRTLYNPPKQELDKSWQARIVPLTNYLLCMHLWRSTLVLCFRGEYDAALMCLHLSSAMDNARVINTACGKHLIFFLGQLLDRVLTGHGSLQQLERDEEMLAYTSGDLQGNLEHAWTWAGTNHVSSPLQGAQYSPRQKPDQPMHDAALSQSFPDPQNTKDWEGWARVEQLIRRLIEEQRLKPVPSYYPTPHNPVKRVQLGAAPEVRSVTAASPKLSNSSRISIANII